MPRVPWGLQWRMNTLVNDNSTCSIMHALPPVLQCLLPKSLQKIAQQRLAQPPLQANADYLDASADRDVYQTGSLLRNSVSKENSLKSIVALKLEEPVERLCLTNRADDARQLLLSLFGRTGLDQVVGFAPQHAQWTTLCAQYQLEMNVLSLYHQLELPVRAIDEQLTPNVKIMVLEHPNPITGALLRPFDVADVAAKFEGLVILDESAIACSSADTLRTIADTCPNVVVIQRFFGTVGVLIADPAVVALLELFKAPVLDALVDAALVASGQAAYPVNQLLREREQMKNQLEAMSHVQRVYASAANTLLLVVADADRVVTHLRKEEYILVHRVPAMEGLEEGIRLTVGTPLDNLRILKAIEQLPQALDKRTHFWKNVSHGLRRASAFLGAFKKIFGGGI